MVNGAEVETLDGLSVTRTLFEVVFGIIVPFDSPSLPPVKEAKGCSSNFKLNKKFYVLEAVSKQ